MKMSTRCSLVLLSLFVTVVDLSLAQLIPPTHIDDFAGHPRVIIISDIGNEPDDQMSLVRLLVYSNELDIEALIPTTSTWQKAASHPETMHALIKAYGQVRPNLLLHAKGWPEADYLDQRVAPMNPDQQVPELTDPVAETQADGEAPNGDPGEGKRGTVHGEGSGHSRSQRELEGDQAGRIVHQAFAAAWLAEQAVVGVPGRVVALVEPAPTAAVAG